eukprot:1789158-Amphidinium_carterae.1
MTMRKTTIEFVDDDDNNNDDDDDDDSRPTYHLPLERSGEGCDAADKVAFHSHGNHPYEILHSCHWLVQGCISATHMWTPF